MEQANNYAIKIANYLDDKMSDAEQEAFMEELGNNEALRRQFEDELLMRNLFSEKAESSLSETDLLLQPADEHLTMLEKAFENKAKQGSPTPVVPVFRRYRMAVAVAIGFIMIGLLALLFNKKEGSVQAPEITEANKNRNSSLRFDSIKNESKTALPINSGSNQVLVQNKKEDSAFRLFYKPYISEKDPPEVGDFYKAYKKGNYAEVLSATDADVQLMGAGDREEALKDYLHFYKGLSYLAQSKTSSSIQQFNQVLHNAAKNKEVFYKAQWYCALAWLKAGNVEKALKVLKKIQGTASPYAAKANSLTSTLKE